MKCAGGTEGIMANNHFHIGSDGTNGDQLTWMLHSSGFHIPATETIQTHRLRQHTDTQYTVYVEVFSPQSAPRALCSSGSVHQ